MTLGSRQSYENDTVVTYLWQRFKVQRTEICGCISNYSQHWWYCWMVGLKRRTCSFIFV